MGRRCSSDCTIEGRRLDVTAKRQKDDRARIWIVCEPSADIGVQGRRGDEAWWRVQQFEHCHCDEDTNQ
jgi:hypothetical protein